MPYPKFNRNELEIKHLSDRKNKVYIEKDQIPVTQVPRNLSEKGNRIIEKTVERIKKARELNPKSPLIDKKIAEKTLYE